MASRKRKNNNQGGDSNSSSSLQHYEAEMEMDLQKDDSEVLQNRYSFRKELGRIATSMQQSSVSSSLVTSSSSSSTTPPARKKSKSHWTRYQDAVQEHFSSHVTLEGVSYKIPSSICALKASSKQSWILYKKRECERRKRIRLRIEHEKEKERKGEPANILLSIVDACEYCRKLYVTVNLFWGTTLCDMCYFNPDIIHELMVQKQVVASNKMIVTNENIVDEILRLHNNNASNQIYFEPPPTHPQPQVVPPPPPPPVEEEEEELVCLPQWSPEEEEALDDFYASLENPSDPFDGVDSDVDLHSFIIHSENPGSL